MLLRIIILLCVVLMVSSNGTAGRIGCLRPPPIEDPEQTTQPARPEGPCLQAHISGTIEVGDAEKLEQFLASEPGVSTIYLFASGGDIFEAMKIGRVIRAKFLRTSAKPLPMIGGLTFGPACGMPGRRVCCASACALAYFGGIEWGRDELIGLHRPTIRDLGDRPYAEAQQALKDAATKIKDYLIEMEIEDRFYSLMMSAPPDQVVIAAIDPTYPNSGNYKHPPSVQDWLQAKCRHKIKRPEHEMERCKLYALADEREHRRNAAKSQTIIEKQVSSMSLADLERRVRDLSDRVLAGERLTTNDYELLDAGRRRVDQARLSEKKDKIDSMSIDELRKYAKENKGFDLAKQRVYKRIEELTGDTLIGDPSVDCHMALNANAIISNCTTVIERGNRETPRARAAAHKRRGEAYVIWNKDYDRAISDFTIAIELSPPLTTFSEATSFFDRMELTELYSARARALSRRGDLDGAISDLTKLIEANPKWGLNYIERAELYERKGDRAAAMSDYRKFLEANPSSELARDALRRLGATP